jgi:hypothetical protein
VNAYYRELNVRYQHRQRAFLDQRCELDIRHQAYAREVAAEAIALGIGMFVSLPVLTLLSPEPVLQSLVPFLAPIDSTSQVPRHSVGDHVEFELPDRAFTVYAFGEV